MRTAVRATRGQYMPANLCDQGTNSVTYPTRMNLGSGSKTWTYDLQRRVTSETDTRDGTALPDELDVQCPRSGAADDVPDG